MLSNLHRIFCLAASRLLDAVSHLGTEVILNSNLYIVGIFVYVLEYGSPGILRKRELSSGTGKSVHWSPVLVRSRSKSPEARKLQRLSGGKSASASLWNGFFHFYYLKLFFGCAIAFTLVLTI